VLAVGRHVHRVEVARVGEAGVVLAVEPHAVQLQLHRVVAVVRCVVEHARLLVDAEDARGLEVVARKRERLTGGGVEAVQVVVLPAGALRAPHEAAAVLQEVHLRRIRHPARRPLLVHHRATLAGVEVGGDVLEHVLLAVGAVQ